MFLHLPLNHPSLRPLKREATARDLQSVHSQRPGREMLATMAQQQLHIEQPPVAVEGMEVSPFPLTEDSLSESGSEEEDTIGGQKRPRSPTDSSYYEEENNCQRAEASLPLPRRLSQPGTEQQSQHRRGTRSGYPHWRMPARNLRREPWTLTEKQTSQHHICGCCEDQPTAKAYEWGRPKTAKACPCTQAETSGVSSDHQTHRRACQLFQTGLLATGPAPKECGGRSPFHPTNRQWRMVDWLHQRSAAEEAASANNLARLAVQPFVHQHKDPTKCRRRSHKGSPKEAKRGAAPKGRSRGPRSARRFSQETQHQGWCPNWSCTGGVH